MKIDLFIGQPELAATIVPVKIDRTGSRDHPAFLIKHDQRISTHIEDFVNQQPGPLHFQIGGAQYILGLFPTINCVLFPHIALLFIPSCGSSYLIILSTYSLKEKLEEVLKPSILNSASSIV